MPSEDDVTTELDLGEPSDELLEYAKKTLREDPETRLQAVEELRDIIFERGECEPHRLDDLFLLRFLRARSFVVESAHRLMVNYYKFKENNPELHVNIRPLDLTFIGEDDVLQIPPYREQTGRRLMIFKSKCWDPTKYSLNEIFKATLVCLELGVLEQSAQILGGICLIDLEGLSMNQTWYVTPSLAAKVVDLMVKAFPMRIHAIHIINLSWVFEMVFNIFKPLLDDRMRQRIHIHNDLESLHKHIDPKYLPERYGGIRPEYSYAEWLLSLTSNSTVVKEVRDLGYIIEEDQQIIEKLKADFMKSKEQRKIADQQRQIERA